ncbi:MAG: carbonic anhydrase, partial [Pseudomonadota bacterium]
MGHIARLPQSYCDRHAGWQATTYRQEAELHEHLADEGQAPDALVITCCDSRVHPMAILGGRHGELFLHRNIANLVPPYTAIGLPQPTAATLEYAV